MRTVLLMRHGKSDRSRPELPDLERPLTRRGERAAAAVGSFLAETGWTPELVVCSPAERARATVRTARAAGSWTCPERLDTRLYEDGAQDFVEVLRGLEDCAARVLLCGHEPTWSELVCVLTGGGRVRMPTAAVAAVCFDVRGWPEVGPGNGVLHWLVVPRLLEPDRAGRGR